MTGTASALTLVACSVACALSLGAQQRTGKISPAFALTNCRPWAAGPRSLSLHRSEKASGTEIGGHNSG
jgi:hypothetical protein